VYCAMLLLFLSRRNWVSGWGGASALAAPSLVRSHAGTIQARCWLLRCCWASPLAVLDALRGAQAAGRSGSPMPSATAPLRASRCCRHRTAAELNKLFLPYLDVRIGFLARHR